MNGFKDNADDSRRSHAQVVDSRNIKLIYEHDNVNVVYTVREMALNAEFNKTEEALVATAASELSTNILRYAGIGEITVSIIKNLEEGIAGIRLLAVDNGPGIPDIGKAMEEKFSSLPNSLGMGLPSVKRIMDFMSIDSSPGNGTKILAEKWNLHE